MKTTPHGAVLSAEQKRRRRARSVAIALTLAAVALLLYAVTIVRLGATAPGAAM
jgi:hypothetical protein